MSEAQAAPVTTETATIVSEAPVINQAPVITETGLSEAPTNSGLDFIPEAYRQAGWATKYKTQDEFFKGIDHMAKTVGAKQVVNGLQVPGENATAEELNAFYAQLGRPESADKYALPEDLTFHEGIDAAAEKQSLADVSFKLGLTNKQAAELAKIYAEKQNETFKESETKIRQKFDEAVLSAFGQDYKANLGLAKRAAKAYDIATTLDNEQLSTNPTVLKILAELGKHVGEDSFEGGSSESKETQLEEALRIQKSPEYINGDKVARRKVREIYQKVYPGNPG